jgi:hypothetical protein
MSSLIDNDPADSSAVAAWASKLKFLKTNASAPESAFEVLDP